MKILITSLVLGLLFTSNAVAADKEIGVIDEFSFNYKTGTLTVKGVHGASNYIAYLKPSLDSSPYFPNRKPEYRPIWVFTEEIGDVGAAVMTPFTAKINVNAYQPPFPLHILERMRRDPDFRPVRPRPIDIKGTKGIMLVFRHVIKKGDGWVTKTRRIQIDLDP
tara:strand:- start:4327 stop:4818 length:492 start_codon:yes stop_codon:yes gene_type:complete